MTRMWLWAFAVCNVLLMGVVLTAIVREANRPYRRLQRNAEALAFRVPRGIVESVGPFGVERCLTCHFNAHIGGNQPKERAALLAQHPHARDGCIGCHGGQGRAVSKHRAHNRRKRARLVEADEMSARCALCHVPGSVAETETVVQGIFAYVELGCPTCHRQAGLRAPADRQGGFGPNLDDVGRFAPSRLRRMLKEPSQHFGEDTAMPAFDGAFAAQPELERSLLLYLTTLRADIDRHRSLTDPQRPCIGCHNGATPRGLEKHRCTWIDTRRTKLDCDRCHQTYATGSRSCLFIDSQRSHCGACHETGASQARRETRDGW